MHVFGVILSICNLITPPHRFSLGEQQQECESYHIFPAPVLFDDSIFSLHLVKEQFGKTNNRAGKLCSAVQRKEKKIVEMKRSCKMLISASWVFSFLLRVFPEAFFCLFFYSINEAKLLKCYMLSKHKSFGWITRDGNRALRINKKIMNQIRNPTRALDTRRSVSLVLINFELNLTRRRKAATVNNNNN